MFAGTLINGVAIDHDGDWQGQNTRIEGQGGRWEGSEIGRSDSRVVGSGVINGDDGRTGIRQADGEGRIDRAAVAFGDGDIVNRDSWSIVVIRDRTDALSIANRGIACAGEINEELLASTLINRVAIDYDRDCL